MTYTDIKNYFETIAAAHRDIMDFREGDADEILEAERSKINYPCLWMETPDVSPEGDTDSYEFRWNGAYTILINSKTGNKDRVDYNLERAFLIASQILVRLRNDMMSGIFYRCSMSGASMERIFTINNDNDQGFRCQYSILAPPPRKCLDTSVWNESYELNTYPAFSYSRDGGNNIIIAQVTTLGAGWVLSERYFQEGTEVAYGSIDNSKEVYYEQSWVYNDNYKYASAYIRPSDASGVSLPLRYNPFFT